MFCYKGMSVYIPKFSVGYRVILVYIQLIACHVRCQCTGADEKAASVESRLIVSCAVEICARD